MGQNIYSALPKDITTTKPVYEQELTEAQYNKLILLDKHSTQTTWILLAEARLFTVMIDVTSAQRLYKSGEPYRAVKMDITIVSEQTL